MPWFGRSGSSRRDGRLARGPQTERRGACRYRTADIRLEVERPSARPIAGLLLDMSFGGAAIVIGDKPAVGETLRLRVDGPGASAWVAAGVVGVARAGRRSWIVRLRFAGECPYTVFRAAVIGDGLEGPASPTTTPEFDDRYWR